MGMGILSWIVLGLVAGWLASQFMRGGYGLIGDIVLGIVGAIVGGIISGVIVGRDMVSGFNLESVVVAFLGAVALIAISRLVSGRGAALAR
jgi:uncharacterized membrane protein YeaQ/YmgE (transglycosylase-associated protein family)